jgi:hypothetical protein
MPLSLNRSIERQAKLEGLDDIKVVTVESASFPRRSWLDHASGLLLMQAALIAGVVLTIYGTRSAGQDFKLLLLSMATLCIGFGAGTLLYRRIGDSRVDELRAEFRNLRARADNLIEKIDNLEHARTESSSRSVKPGTTSGSL